MTSDENPERARPNSADPPRGGARPDSPPPRVRVSSPDAVLAIVPHLLGFHPDRSLVVLGVRSRSDQVCLAFRYDLPDPPDAEVSADIAAHACAVLGRAQIPAAIVIGYGPAGLAGPAIEPAIGAMLHAGVDVLEVLRAEGGRYWSALCRDPACCPAGGVSYDPCSHPAAAALSEAGIDAYPDRAALARTLEPAPGSSRVTRQATTRALRRADALIAAAQQAGTDPAAALAAAGRRAVRQAIRQYRAGGAAMSAPRRAFLAVALADLRVRDDAWARMDPEFRACHLRLWTDVVIGAAPEFVPGPASLLAFAAWQSGEGALANVAVERALAADPAYTMAQLIGQAVQAGLPPSAARLPMTPAEVETSYAAGGRPDGPGRPGLPRRHGAKRPDDKLPEPFVQFGTEHGQEARWVQYRRERPKPRGLSPGG